MNNTISNFKPFHRGRSVCLVDG